MRTFDAKLFVVVLLLLVFQTISIGQNSNTLSEKKYAIAEQNYLVGLESSNIGMRANSAFYLGEMKSQAAVSNLIHMIRNDKCTACRILAALSLFKIGDKTGIHEIKMIREFVPSEDNSSDKNYISHLSVLWGQYLNSHPEESLVLKNIRFPDEAN